MIIDLSSYDWHVAGYSPHSWKMGRVLEQAIPCVPEIAPVPATVPGSVHQALFNAGVLPDWNKGLNSFKCEWVDHRDWIFSTSIPRADLENSSARMLNCLGLDGYGIVMLNRNQIGTFRNAYVPHVFDFSDVELEDDNTLEIIFNDLPRFNGTPNVSSEIREYKARYNYSWDWMPRNVQIGIWDEMHIELDVAAGLDELKISTQYDISKQAGSLHVQGELNGSLRVSLEGQDLVDVSASDLKVGFAMSALQVKPWQTNGQGDAALYDLRLELLNDDGDACAVREERVGFRHIEWVHNTPTPDGADPWICTVNGESVFLIGVNWTPIRAHYADVTDDDYRKRLQAYKDIGFNVMRVWGGAFLEKDIFYRLCDEMGILVWQEFPLSSSGPDNTPPDDAETIDAFAETARSYIRRRRHHASLLIWCGGNELQHAADGSAGIGVPWTVEHPMLKRFAEVCAEEDPHTRYLPCSSSGPIFVADEKDFGKGIHWDVHGPWRLPHPERDKAQAYWDTDDSLFRSEAGAPGCSSMEVLNEFYPDCDLLPVSTENPYWRRTFWWIDEDGFELDHGRKPETIDEYVEWSQAHQAEALVMATKSCRERFPRIGGLIFWMGHDSFPCLANTSILDFYGDPKPAAIAIKDYLTSQG